MSPSRCRHRARCCDRSSYLHINSVTVIIIVLSSATCPSLSCPADLINVQLFWCSFSTQRLVEPRGNVARKRKAEQENVEMQGG